VRDLGFVKDEAVFEFGGISSDNAVAKDHVFPNVAPVADLAVFSNPSRAFDHSALFNNGAFADEDSSTHKRFADEAAMNARLEAELQVGGNFRQGVPNILGVLEKCSVFAVAKIKKFVDGKHSVLE
jgi:hypothetical protein